MHFLVSVPINENLASFIGKKGSEDGLVFFNRKLGDNTIVAIMPANKEDRVYYNMAESMLICTQIVISTETVDKSLGEAVVAASLAGKHIIITDDNDVSGIVGGLLEDFEVAPMDALLDRITGRNEVHEGRLRIDVDKSFPVKGIGTVALGIVTNGVVKVHDTLYSGDGKQATVKSIQSQDIDVAEAGYGTRVGLALKGIEHNDLGKGDLLLAEPYRRTRAARISLRISPASKEAIEPQGRYMFVSNLSRAFCKMEEVGADSARVAFEKPLSVLSGDRFLLIRDASPRIFASGTVTECII
ncbi:MAG: hypothetical protein M1569_02620 [Candidatus Marsarchaeota archaeon]|nr:hypothetical protein [Candidatus Marsarchaeota archaeon]MCL5413274.1 hypothetical protein [Candidatus Marsarchaeota archaeon]